MDDYRMYRRPRPSTRALTAKVAVVAVIATLLIGALIAAEMAAGNDPSLGPKAAARAKKDSAKPSYDDGYGDDGYYDSGSSADSADSGAYTYSPPPVTSSTS